MHCCLSREQGKWRLEGDIFPNLHCCLSREQGKWRLKGDIFPNLHCCLSWEQGKWRLEGDIFPTVQELVESQHESGEAVTKKSEVVLKKAVRREDWELSNSDLVLGQKIGNVSLSRVLSWFSGFSWFTQGSLMVLSGVSQGSLMGLRVIRVLSGFSQGSQLSVHSIHTSVFSFTMFTATTVLCYGIKDCLKVEIRCHNYPGMFVIHQGISLKAWEPCLLACDLGLLICDLFESLGTLSPGL